MSKVNYYLKGIPSSEKLEELKKESPKEYSKEIMSNRPIIISISNFGERLIISTGKFISMKHWNMSTQTIKTSIDLPTGSREDKIWLDAKKNEIEKLLHLAYQERRLITKEELYIVLEKELCLNKKSEWTLFEKLDIFLNNHVTKYGTPIVENSKKKFITLVKTHWVGYQGGDINFIPNKYNNAWVEGFQKYLLENGCNDNSKSKYIDALRTFFKYFMMAGEKFNLDLSKIKTYEFEQEIIILNKAELKQLFNWQPKDSAQSKVKDIFLFQCFTGARYSDILKIKREEVINIERNLCWSYVPKKVIENRIVVPLSDNAKEILNKYKDLETPLPKMSNQVLNRQLKSIAKLAGLNRIVKLITCVNGKLSERYLPLHEILSTHIARKTYISLSLQMGIPAQFVKAVSGHRDDKSFRRYVNLANEHFNPILNKWNENML